MAKFCGKCGTGLDAATGLCPNCDREKLSMMTMQLAEPEETGVTVELVQPEEVVKPVAPAQPEAPAKPASQKKSKKRRSKGLTTTITVLLSICLFCTSLLAVTICDVRNTVKEDNLEEMLEDLQFEDAIDLAVMNDDDLERFYNYVEKVSYAQIGIRELNDVINESSIKEFVAEKVSEFCDDFFVGDAELSIKKKEILEILLDNADVIEKEVDMYITDSELEKIANWIFDEKEIVLVDTYDVKDDSPVLYYTLRIGLSYVAMGLFIVLSLLLIYLMIRNNLSQAACGAGIIFIILGALRGMIALMSILAPNIWTMTGAEALINTIIGKFMVVNALTSVVLLAAGLLVLLARGITIKICAKKRK